MVSWYRSVSSGLWYGSIERPVTRSPSDDARHPPRRCGYCAAQDSGPTTAHPRAKTEFCVRAPWRRIIGHEPTARTGPFAMSTGPASEPDTSSPPPRTRDARGDLAVIGALLPYLRPYLGRIVLSLGLILAS